MCGENKRRYGTLLGGPICGRCRQRIRRSPKPCPGCSQVKVVDFLDEAGDRVCASCAGQTPIFACVECGREDNPYGVRCGRCTLHGRANALLSDGSGTIHPQLVPVFDALINVDRPQTTLFWFNRSTGPEILRRMAQGDLEISHRTFQQMPRNKTNDYVHDLLIAVGVLSPYHGLLERIEPWLRDLLADLPKDHVEIIQPYARWHVLRRLRAKANRDRLTRSMIQCGRTNIREAVYFLTWLAESNLTADTATQADLETYAIACPGKTHGIRDFLHWAIAHQVTPGLSVPTHVPTTPEVTTSHEDRWAQVELLLHDETIRLYTRIAGLFVLLFAQPLARVCQMKADQISTNGEKVTVTFDRVPLELPSLLDHLVIQHLDERGQASYAATPDQWLFPGGIPGRHLTTENIRAQLVERGIRSGQTRKTAMFQLAAEIPTPLLADLLGLGQTTAVRWATLASRDWSQYTALRHANDE